MTFEDYKSFNCKLYEMEKNQLPDDTQVDDIDNHMAWRKVNLTEQDIEEIVSRTLDSLKVRPAKWALYHIILSACKTGFNHYCRGEK